MSLQKGIAVALAVVGLSGAVLAQSDSQTEVPRGLWETPLSEAGIRFHVRTKRCGSALCGRVERVKDRRGYDTPSTMVGQKVLWDLKPQPDGSFLGKMVDSQGNWLSETRIEARSGKLHLRACGDDGCQDLVWKRLR